MPRLKAIYLNSHTSNNITQVIPPFRFGIVEHGVFRGGYPKEKNLSYLKKLNLKTIISLTPEPLNTVIANFCSSNGIEMIHFKVEKPKDSIPLTRAIVFQALQILISDKRPVYIHCLDGANVTGLIIMCLRKLQLWSSQVAMAEFARFTRDYVVSTEETDFLEKFGHPNQNIVLPITITLLNPVVKDETSTNAEVDFICNFPPHSSNIMEIELLENLPKWLWNGIVPQGFLRDMVLNQNFSHSSNVVSCLVTYGHPFIRVRLTPSQTQKLLTFDKNAILNLFPAVNPGKSFFNFIPTNALPVSRSSSTSINGSNILQDYKVLENARESQVYSPAMNENRKKGSEHNSVVEIEISQTVKALALEGMK